LTFAVVTAVPEIVGERLSAARGLIGVVVALIGAGFSSRQPSSEIDSSATMHAAPKRI
jgi:hypothetical protein